MKATEALEKKLEQYRRWAIQAEQSGETALAERYAKLRDGLSGILGDRIRRQNRRQEAALRDAGPSPRPGD